MSMAPTIVEGGLKISQGDLDLFKKLTAQSKKLSDVIKALKKHKKLSPIQRVKTAMTNRKRSWVDVLISRIN